MTSGESNFFIIDSKNYSPTSTHTTLNRPSAIGVAKYGALGHVPTPIKQDAKLSLR